jgi:uncharacterized protein (TIGR02145 family)
MKTKLFTIGMLLLFSFSCKKDDASDPMNQNEVTDIDGNVYKTVTIGTQVWMVENLKTTRYRNGDLVPNKTDAIEWSNLTTGAYCDYDNTPSNSAIYGRLYNSYAVIDSRNIAPAGWHIPSDAEWTTLTDYLGGVDVAGAKLKEIGTAHWKSPNTGADNNSNFSALPGGGRIPNYYGTIFTDFTYGNIGFVGYWWTSDAIVKTIHCNSETVSEIHDYDFDYYYRMKSGFSVRCIKDN